MLVFLSRTLDYGMLRTGAEEGSGVPEVGDGCVRLHVEIHSRHFSV